MRAVILAIGLLVATAARADERPDGFLARATPGLGVGVDGGPSCRVRGVTLVGGFWVGYAVAPGLLVGGAAALALNGLPADDRCDDVEVGQVFMASVFGASIDWYPSPRSGLHLIASAGVAQVEHAPRAAMATEHVTSDGLGGVLALGYDRGPAVRAPDGNARLGLELRLTAFRTGGAVRHAALVPSVNASFAFD